MALAAEVIGAGGAGGAGGGVFFVAGEGVCFFALNGGFGDLFFAFFALAGAGGGFVLAAIGADGDAFLVGIFSARVVGFFFCIGGESC